MNPPSRTSRLSSGRHAEVRASRRQAPAPQVAASPDPTAGVSRVAFAAISTLNSPTPNVPLNGIAMPRARPASGLPDPAGAGPTHEHMSI